MAQRTGLAFRAKVDQLRRHGVVGVVLATRDGHAVLANGLDIPDLDVFVAMHAAALGAAEHAIARGSACGAVALVADVDGERFISRTITPRFFLVALVRKDADCRALAQWMEDLGRELA